ncbi:MAG: pseudaminic acid biosynthesis-associated methylase [Desulfamplus sp.]|nr:pseudaminic acid biosynthesis-associated methylase [Desulfamplus sp.]
MTKSQYQTTQEKLWAGEFGDEYSDRNQGEDYIASNLALFSRILQRTRKIETLLELGANIGMNMMALRQLLPKCKLHAVEINQYAVEKLKSAGDITVFNQSLLDFTAPVLCDFVFTRGVLFHINPEQLPKAYAALYNSSKKYICVAEYYNISPVSIPYRGKEDQLFKRDFAGEMLELYPDLQLLDYGFIYHKDPQFAQVDLTWFLMEKNGI